MFAVLLLNGKDSKNVLHLIYARVLLAFELLVGHANTFMITPKIKIKK